VVATGSFGRREASGESDIDFFVLHGASVSRDEADKLVEQLAAEIQSIVPRAPSEDGAFRAAEAIPGMLANIGGSDDTNPKMTRRMLLLLEGVSLCNAELFEGVKQQILERYVRPGITVHGLARFLLNDVIRYYRTMCVDFEYKTVERGKTWGVRNLKLLYSRKMLYFGGVLAVAETADRTREQKLDQLSGLLSLTPIQRLEQLFGDGAWEALGLYNKFLAALGDEALRRQLDSATADRSTHSERFTALKAESIQFSFALQRLLDSRYPPGHPIHQALIY
jgi:hypothetical protein